MTNRTAAHLIAEAKAHVSHVTAEEVAAELEDTEVLLVDLRAPRGMLEFYADPTSAYFHQAFDPARRTILYCASGGRAALAAETLTRLGYTQVTYLKGGLHAWVEAGYRVEPST
jgi:rhodanese-related sulfurtransferase